LVFPPVSIGERRPGVRNIPPLWLSQATPIEGLGGKVLAEKAGASGSLEGWGGRMPGGGGAVGVWLLGRRLADERGQDVAEYAGVLVLATALIAAVVSLGLGTRLANAVRCLAGLSCQRRRHGGSGLLVLRDPVHE